MTQELSIIKPQPISFEGKPLTYTQGMDLNSVLKTLEKGELVLINEFYNDGLLLLKHIHSHLRKNLGNNSMQEQRIYRSEFQKLSNRVIIEIKDHTLHVKKAPKIGWLEKFYHDLDSFYLPFPQVQGLNSAWQWYKNGISIPVLRNKLHPYYGVYFPTRFEHLLVFDKWLERYEGPKKSAIEVGIGSGVLTMQMVQHGFQKVYGTDLNPNAILGLKEFMGTTKLSRKIELDFNSLFGKWNKPTELIVFNPPWIPANQETMGMDQAIYYDENLFPEFFSAAKDRLLKDGKLLLIFSNLAQITGITNEHPIENEIEHGGRFKLNRVFKKAVSAASEKTKRNANWRSKEEVELWELAPI